MPYPRELSCAFTGYRPEKMPWKGNECCSEIINLKHSIDNQILIAMDNGFKYFISGMSRGFDIWCAESVVRLKSQFDIHLVCALPFTTQHSKWSNSWQQRFLNVLKNSRYTFCISDKMSKTAYLERNRYMVDHCSLIIAYYDNKSGGTAHTIKYANKNNIDVINLADNQMTLF